MARKKVSSIGGQAVLEGVMMRGVSGVATAVRKSDGTIAMESSRAEAKKWWSKVPILRGFLSFFVMMFTGSKILMRSAEVYGEEMEEEPTSKTEKWLAKTFHVDVMTIASIIGIVLGLAISVVLFVIAPQHLVDYAINKPLTTHGYSELNPWIANLIVGVLRILIFVCYILTTSLMKDIKRVWMYHGAEHKTISCYEHDLPLTVENVRKQTTRHDRCGTNFIVIVMLVSVLVFSLATSWIPDLKTVYKVLIKLALLPFVAGISYELLKFLAKFDNIFARILKAPGLLMQKLTTREPTDDMIEVAIAAFEEVQKLDADSLRPTCSFDIKKGYEKCRQEVEAYLENEEEISAMADLIFLTITGKSRSELPLLTTISEKEYNRAIEVAKEVKDGRPVQYALGETCFYGYTFEVNENVLIPRFDTESVVEKALSFVVEESKVLDLCTGSGAIAVTVAKEKGASVTASDISEKALELALRNAQKNQVLINFIHSDMFDKIEEKYDVIICNPPYISKQDMKKLPKNVQKEPELALYGGIDGLDYYRIIAEKVGNYLTENGVLVLEIGDNEGKDVVELLTGFDTEIGKDLNGLDRFVVAKKIQ